MSTDLVKVDNFLLSCVAQAEQFLMAARNIPRVQQKLCCIQYKMDFTARVDELRYV